MTPIFMRIWLMKTTIVRDFEIVPASLRSACDMRRACRPICGSPMSPSISARGTRAATESITSTSIAPERAGGERGDVGDEGSLAEPHDRALAELLLDLAESEVDRPFAIHVDGHVPPSPRRCVCEMSYSTLAATDSPAAALPIFSHHEASPREREGGKRLVDGARRPEAAAVEDHALRRPASKIHLGGALDRGRDPAQAARRADAGDGHVAAEGTVLRWEAERLECPLERGSEATELRHPGRNAGKEHARSPEARE